jgi:hypothetical protein
VGDISAGALSVDTGFGHTINALSLTPGYVTPGATLCLVRTDGQLTFSIGVSGMLGPSS